MPSPRDVVLLAPESQLLDAEPAAISSQPPSITYPLHSTPQTLQDSVTHHHNTVGPQLSLSRHSDSLCVSANNIIICCLG